VERLTLAEEADDELEDFVVLDPVGLADEVRFEDVVLETGAGSWKEGETLEVEEGVEPEEVESFVEPEEATDAIADEAEDETKWAEATELAGATELAEAAELAVAVALDPLLTAAVEISMLS